MSIIKECARTADFKAYVNQNPAIIQHWQKGGRLTWNRILIAKTDQCEAVVFSVTLPVRIYAWVKSLFLIFGNYYANTLHAKKVTFLDPSCLSKLNQKTVQVGQQVLPKTARTPPVVNQPHILELPKLLDSNPQRPIVMHALKQIVDQGAPLPALSPQQEKALIESA